MNESSLPCDLDNALSCDNCGSPDVENEDGKLYCFDCNRDPRWFETYDNVTTLGRELVECGFDARQLQAYYEKPWQWTPEWHSLKREQRK